MDWKKLSTIKIKEVYKSLFFDRCHICYTKSHAPLCKYCQMGFTENIPSCQHCKLPLTGRDFLCGQCQTSPPPYQLCIAPYVFEGIMQNLIHRIKFSEEGHFIRPLTYLLSKEIISTYANQSWPDQLLYVPSHPARIKERGFCQTQMMANQLIKQLESNLSATQLQLQHPNPLKKHKNTHAQHTLTRKERLKAPFQSYEATHTVSKHVALFDDVMTTGSTLNACCHLLKKHGAERIDVWVLARTPDNKDTSK